MPGHRTGENDEDELPRDSRVSKFALTPLDCKTMAGKVHCLSAKLPKQCKRCEAAGSAFGVDARGSHASFTNSARSLVYAAALHSTGEVDS